MMEYDQAAWGYTLFEGGEMRDQFWNFPDAVEMPAEECVGSVHAVAPAFGVPAESITPYIRHVTESDYNTKAFADDEFTLGDHWVRVDFMQRLGVPYPEPGEVAGGRYIQIQEPRRLRRA